MLMIKVDSRIIQDLFRSMPLLDEFCIIYTEEGTFNVLSRNPENTMAARGTIQGGVFDYLLANELSFAVNLVKVKSFLEGIDRRYPTQAVLHEDRGLFSLTTRHIEREFRYLHPDSVDLDIFEIPERYGDRWTTEHNEFQVVTRGLEDVSTRTVVTMVKDKINFISREGGDSFSFSKKLEKPVEKEILVELMTKNLSLVSEHLKCGEKSILYFQQDSPLILENFMGEGSSAVYLVAHLAREQEDSVSGNAEDDS